MVEAENFIRDGRFDDATVRFRDALAIITERKIRVPLDPADGGGVLSPVYLSFTMDECITAMTCCHGLSHCFNEMKQYKEVRTFSWQNRDRLLEAGFGQNRDM